MRGSVLDAIWRSFDKSSVVVAANRRRVTFTLRHGRQKIQLHLPAAEAPEVLLEVKPEFVCRKPVPARLDADYDAEGRLVLSPKYGDLSNLDEGRVRGTRWYWDGNRFQKLGVPDRKMARFFDPDAKLIYEGDEIPQFLNTDFVQLMACLSFRASERVIKSRIARPQIASAKLRPGLGRWYEADLKLSIGEQTLALSDILKLQGKLKYVRQGDTWVEVEKAVETVEQEGVQIVEGRARIPRDRRPRFQHSIAQDIPDLAPGPEPQGLRSSLRNYQRAGYDWLWWLRESGLGGILADDMGLGKTHQTMALLVAAYEAGAQCPTLVVCPASVVDHWYRKLRDHAPTLMPYIHHGAGRLEGADEFRVLRVVLTTYGLLVRDVDVLEQVEWEHVILDEAHIIKNPSTAVSQAARRLNAAHRFALTGTPIENRPVELWSIFDYLMPGYLGSLEAFRRDFESPILADEDGALERLRERIYPFTLRRLKSDVLDELPPKQEDKIFCDMTPHQEALYRAVIEKSGTMLADLADASKPVDYMHVFSTLTRLKQICDHPALAIENGDPDRLQAGKFETFKEILQQCLDSGQKVVVFSQYVQMLRIIQRHLKSVDVDHVVLEGGTRDRAAVCEKFRTDPACRVFVASLLAGGVGIDLQAASVVIHYDRWWNKAKEDQATDRVHRLGQTRGVQVFKLITRGTLEEKIDRLISTKGEVFDGIIGSEREVSKTLSRHEMLELLHSVA